MMLVVFLAKSVYGKVTLKVKLAMKELKRTFGSYLRVLTLLTSMPKRSVG